MDGTTHHQDAFDDVVRQLTAISAIRRRLVRQLPHELGTGTALLPVIACHGERRLRALADQLDLDLSVVSRQVAHLERQGAVARRPHPEDRRSSLVSLTPQGLAMLDALTRAHADLIAAATADWTPGELDTLSTLLERLRDGLAQRMHGPERRDDAPHREAPRRSAPERSATERGATGHGMRGHDAQGQVAPGHDAQGQVAPGQDAPGQESSAPDASNRSASNRAPVG